jgi:hypothetical protein
MAILEPAVGVLQLDRDDPEDTGRVRGRPALFRL